MSDIIPRRSLGQNFLVDPNTAKRIVGSLRARKGCRVVEIGPGTGALTRILYELYPGMVAFEIDNRAVESLRLMLPGLDVRHQDVLEVDWARFSEGLKASIAVIGNLPYHITSPILFTMLENALWIDEAVLMMQLEVAKRLVASPGTKAYGILSVAVQLVTRPEMLFRVSRHVFRPRPSITSAVVRLSFQKDGPRVPYTGMLKETVRAAFNQRRKTLKNSLAGLAQRSGREIPERWSDRRAEELSPEEFVELARYLGPAP